MTKEKVKLWREEIPLKDLSLWDENPRFPEEYFNKPEGQLIDYFLKKKDFRIEAFAREVVNEFDLLQLEKIVVLSVKGKKVVLEGNRRIIVYKLLADPTLTNDASIQTLFINLAKEIKITPTFKLEALVSSDKNLALRYVDRKHTKRNNEIGWGEPERHNYKVRRGNATAKTEVFRYELGKLVRKLDIPDEIKESVLGRGYVSTFYRLMDSEPAQKSLGFEKNDDGTIKIKNQKDFDEKLKVIVFDIVTKRAFEGEKIDSRFLNKTRGKENYLDSINTTDIKRVQKEIKASTTTDIFGNKVVDIKTTKGASIYSERTRMFLSLIDPTLLLPRVKSEKIKEIFSELQKVNTENCSTASALLLRTLMEITVAEAAEKLKITVDNNGYFRTDSGKAKESLKEKMDYISEKFASQDIRDCVKVFNGNSVFTDNLNKIAHSRHIFSSKDKVKSLWKDSRAFWEFLISKIIEIEKKES